MAPGSDRGRRRVATATSLEDCCCPVCLEIFMEPVTLPCTHTFCKECFLESVDKAALCCPLCRKRVSTWARLNSRTNTLVDQQLWTQIQTRFPLQCQRRLNGQDTIAEDDPGVSVCFPRVSQPGELKQEYEDQVTRLTEEKRALEEEERRASEEFIQKLLQEEKQLVQEETRRREEDERLARLLSSQLNSVSQEEVTPAKKKKKEVSGGQMERFLLPLRPHSSFTVDQVQEEAPPPELDYYGSQTKGQTDRSDQLHHGGPSSAKRKSSELETTEDEEWQEELLRRRQQEEEDRRLALLLQKELDQEEKQRATNRCKGSSDPYPLRANRRGSSDTPRKTANTSSSSSSSSASWRKTTNTSSSSSSASSGKTTNPSSSSSSASSGKTTNPSSSSRGSKQATLTEMFSSLSS